MVSQVRSGSWWINLSVEIVHNVLRAYRSHPLYAHSWFNALYPAIAIHSIFELDHIHNTIVFKYMLWKKSISPVFCVDFIHFIHMLSSIHCQVSWTTWWLTCKFTHYKVFCFYKKKTQSRVCIVRARNTIYFDIQTIWDPIYETRLIDATYVSTFYFYYHTQNCVWRVCIHFKSIEHWG